MQQLIDSYPDIIEFIVAKIQNPIILQHIAENFDDELIREEAQKKLKFAPLPQKEREVLEIMAQYENVPGRGGFTAEQIKEAVDKLKAGGEYVIENDQILTGANISVAVTNDLMEAVKNDTDWTLRFPDVDNYDEEEMKVYDKEYGSIADPREWEKLGHAIKDYYTLPARELWKLITFAATHSAEPGIFFIDRANEMATSQAYGQKVSATNPCGV